jgi:hypothetical protein
MKKLLALIALPLLTACEMPETEPQHIPSLPEGGGSRSRLYRCDRANDDPAEWRREHPSTTLAAWLTSNAVTEVGATPIEERYLVQFARELSKFPQPIRARMIRGNARIHVLQGRGVANDPTWDGGDNTFDGRPWAEVPGSGGSPYSSTARRYHPTRLVANRLYEGHGSINLVLHEHGHSLDSLRSRFWISHATPWKRLLEANPGFVDLLRGACGSYCTDNLQEGFAEGFAIYHSCDDNKRLVTTEFPAVAAYLDGLELPAVVDSAELLF